MKNSIEISTRKSSDGKYVFVDRMLISIGDLTFGDGEAVSVSGLMLGEIDDLLSNIEKQKNNVDFAKRVFDQTLPPAHFFQLLHDAWVDGEWSKNLGHSLLAPDAYIGLPCGTEIFDSSEAYFVVVDFEKAFLFANDEAKNEVVALKIDVIDYVKIWEQARAEIVFGKNGVA
jgi:hypothetical protein